MAHNCIVAGSTLRCNRRCVPARAVAEFARVLRPGGVLMPAILSGRFGGVALHPHTSEMVCDDPAAVLAFITSGPAGREATPERLEDPAEAVDERFRASGGVLHISREAGCFVARDPARME
jgi:hypothetical protein